MIYLRITRPDGQVLAASSKSFFKYQNATLTYSARREIEYEDESAQRGESEAAVPEKQPVLEELSLEEISRTEEEDEERLGFFKNRRFLAPTTCSFLRREKAGNLRMF